MTESPRIWRAQHRFIPRGGHLQPPVHHRPQPNQFCSPRSQLSCRRPRQPPFPSIRHYHPQLQPSSPQLNANEWRAQHRFIPRGGHLQPPVHHRPQLNQFARSTRSQEQHNHRPCHQMPQHSFPAHQRSLQHLRLPRRRPIPRPAIHPRGYQPRWKSCQRRGSS